MVKKKFDETKRYRNIARTFQEAFIKHSDMDYTCLSIKKVRQILGSIYHMDKTEHCRILSDMEKDGLIKRTKFNVTILPV